MEEYTVSPMEEDTVSLTQFLQSLNLCASWHKDTMAKWYHWQRSSEPVPLISGAEGQELKYTLSNTTYTTYILKFFRTSENGLNSAYFRKIAHKIAKANYFPNIFDDSDSPINSLSDDI